MINVLNFIDGGRENVFRLIGTRIAIFRTKHDLDRFALSQLSGVKLDEIEEIESGKAATIREESLSRLCRALGVGLDVVVPLPRFTEKPDAMKALNDEMVANRLGFIAGTGSQGAVANEKMAERAAEIYAMFAILKSIGKA